MGVAPTIVSGEISGGVGTLGNNRPFRGQAGKSSWSTFPRLPLSWRLSGCLALLVSRLISPLASRSRRWLRLKWLNETARYIKRRKGAEMLMGDGNGPRRRRGRDWQVCESRAAVCEARVERGLLLHLVDGDN